MGYRGIIYAYVLPDSLMSGGCNNSFCIFLQTITSFVIFLIYFEIINKFVLNVLK